MTDPWVRAKTALHLLAVDPAGIAGLWLRARSGPVRDAVLAGLAAVPLPQRRLHPDIGDDALFGGLDLAATLGAGSSVMTAGILTAPALLMLTMAERCGGGLAARLGRCLDAPGHCVVALDEGADGDEAVPGALQDRLGLFVDLNDVAWSDADDFGLNSAALAAARARLPFMKTPNDSARTLTVVADRLGIASLRAPTLALAVARASAALAGRDQVGEDDLRVAVELALAHRATQVPSDDAQDPPPAPPPPEDQSPPDPASRPEDRPMIPEDMLVDAARAALPSDLLAALAAGRARRAAKGASGTGAARGGNRRGRPLPSRPGRLGGGARVDLVATLRVAAPWQPMRRAQTARVAEGVLVWPSDIRIKRFREMSDRVLIFAVDASGSAAVARLSEAKGAVELLLGQAYARRDHVSLLAFRGRAAELILPPTRSLVQTKRRLAGLPGGGGTPLAAGLELALDTAQRAFARGLTPTIALLTDGRGNIALDGTPDRVTAEADAMHLARAIRRLAVPTVVIDTANRPQPALKVLADTLGAIYLALPRADAYKLSAVLGQVLGD
jgi:magnesium chelatase subunit D